MTAPAIDPSEREIVGSWIARNGEIVADPVCRRIERLTSDYLVRVAASPIWGDWEVLFRDPADGRYWERVFPQSESQGGGPPTLRVLDQMEASEKYGLE